MDAGELVVLATIGAVALLAVAAVLVTLIRAWRARRQTRRAQALLDAHASAWASVTDAAGHHIAGRSGGCTPDRPAPEPRQQVGSSPRHALPAAAHHERTAS